jgi:hypothetical protein
MGTLEDWADKLAQRLEDKRTRYQREEDAVALRRRIISEKLPLVWEDLVEEFRKHAEAINARLKLERKLVLVKEHNCFSIKPDARGVVIRGTLDLSSQRVLIEVETSKHWYEPHVEMKGNGTLYLAAVGGNIATPAEAAEVAFDKLFESANL